MSSSDTSVDSTSSSCSTEVNVLELLNSKLQRALAWKVAEIKDLRDQLQGRQDMALTLEEENKRLLESLKSTSERLVKYEKDLQDIRQEAREGGKKLKKENYLLQEIQGKEKKQEMITKLKKTEEKDRKNIARLQEVQQKLTEELAKIKEDKDHEISLKVKEAQEKFNEEMLKIKEEKEKEMFTKLKETEKRFAGEIEKLAVEKDQLLRKKKVRGTEKDVLESPRKRGESQEGPRAVGSDNDISVLFKQIKRRKQVAVFTHNY